VIAIETSLGSVRLNKFTRKHGRNNRHRDPSQNAALMGALTRNNFRVVDRLASEWKGHQTTNVVLLIRTAGTTFLVVLKAIKDHFLLITAYPAHARQLRRYAGA
jgi:hypothetical protein